MYCFCTLILDLTTTSMFRNWYLNRKVETNLILKYFPKFVAQSFKMSSKKAHLRFKINPRVKSLCFEKIKGARRLFRSSRVRWTFLLLKRSTRLIHKIHEISEKEPSRYFHPPTCAKISSTIGFIYLFGFHNISALLSQEVYSARSYNTALDYRISSL